MPLKISLASAALGASTGLLIWAALINSPLSIGPLFWGILPLFHLYWPFPVLGACIGWFVFYLIWKMSTDIRTRK